MPLYPPRFSDAFLGPFGSVVYTCSKFYFFGEECSITLPIPHLFKGVHYNSRQLPLIYSLYISFTYRSCKIVKSRKHGSGKTRRHRSVLRFNLAMAFAFVVITFVFLMPIWAWGFTSAIFAVFYGHSFTFLD